MVLPDINPNTIRRVFYNPLTSEKLFETNNIDEATNFVEENIDVVPLIMEAYDKDRFLGTQNFLRPEYMN